MKSPIISISLFVICLIIILPSCRDKKGCTDPMALNYDPEADTDDGSCTLPLPEDSTGKLEIKFVPEMNGNPFSVNQVFTGPNNLNMTMEQFKFLLSDISLTGSSGNTVVKEIALMDFSSTSKTILIDVLPGNYSGMSFGLGVKNSLNGTSDPDYNSAQWNDAHPLSIYNGMYWSWATGYIFLKLEGKIDTSSNQNQTPGYNWFYHVGTDTSYTIKEITDANFSIVKGQTTVIELGIEVNELFRTDADTINMVDDYFTHTTDNLDLALKVINNLKQSIRKL